MKNDLEEDKNEEKLENENKINYKKIGAIVSIACFLIVLLEIILNAFQVNFETKIIVEILSYAIAIFASLKIVKTKNNSKNFIDIQKEIKDDFNKNLESLKQSEEIKNLNKKVTEYVGVKNKENSKKDEPKK